MPSFDIVSELNPHEVANAIDQANREVGTRFDFKGTGAKFELAELRDHAERAGRLPAQADDGHPQAEADQARHRHRLHESRRAGVTGQTAKQVATLRQGIDTELGKKLQRLIKDSKLKVQAAIQDKQVRVTRQEPGRSAGSDRAGPRRQARAAAAVHELPRLSG